MRLLIRISVTPTLNVPPETVLVPRYAKCMKPVHWRRWSSQAQLLEHRGNTHKQWRHNAPTTNHFWCTPKVERKREREREKHTIQTTYSHLKDRSKPLAYAAARKSPILRTTGYRVYRNMKKGEGSNSLEMTLRRRWNPLSNCASQTSLPAQT